MPVWQLLVVILLGLSQEFSPGTSVIVGSPEGPSMSIRVVEDDWLDVMRVAISTHESPLVRVNVKEDKIIIRKDSRESFPSFPGAEENDGSINVPIRDLVASMGLRLGEAKAGYVAIAPTDKEEAEQGLIATLQSNQVILYFPDGSKGHLPVARIGNHE